MQYGSVGSQTHFCIFSARWANSGFDATNSLMFLRLSRCTLTNLSSCRMALLNSGSSPASLIPFMIAVMPCSPKLTWEPPTLADFLTAAFLADWLPFVAAADLELLRTVVFFALFFAMC